MKGDYSDGIRGLGKRGGFCVEIGWDWFSYLILSNLISSIFRFQFSIHRKSRSALGNGPKTNVKHFEAPKQFCTLLCFDIDKAGML